MKREAKNKIVIFFATIVLGLGLYFLVSSSPTPTSIGSGGKAHVIFLDVGQGDAILIQEEHTQILIDGGNGQEILDRLGEVMPLYDKDIDMVVETHPDEDHMGGLLKVLESYKVGEVLEPGVACDKDMCRKQNELVSLKKIPVMDAKLGEEIKFSDDIDISVLYPFQDIGGKQFTETNNESVVLRATIAGKKYLFTGDMEDAEEKELMASNLDLDADILKVAHHGSKYSTSAAFLQAVTPEKAVISVGKDNKYGHPTEEVLTRLRNMNIEILRTDEKGNITF